MPADPGLVLVLADECDAAAARFVSSRHATGARLLRPADLSQAGWSYRVGSGDSTLACVDGERIEARRIRGVLSRLVAVAEHHLPQVDAADRAYVAAEMGAFLIAWLSALPCPVVNRPVPPSLAGPSWHWAQWARLAWRLGLAVAPLHCSVRPGIDDEADSATAPPTTAPPLRVDVVGDVAVNEPRPALADQARRLARAAGVSQLGLWFDADLDDALLVGIDPWADLDQPAVADQAWAVCGGRRHPSGRVPPGR